MKLNQFAVYRVDQNTEGKVLWHLPYQEASRQNVPICVEYYRQMSIQSMQETEKVMDIWMKSFPSIYPVEYFRCSCHDRYEELSD